MAVTYLVDDLLTGAKVRANHPDVGGRPTDGEILRMANGAMLGIMTGRLMESVSAELAVESTVAVVAGQSRYPLPSRAAGPKLRYVVVSDAQNNRYPLTLADGSRWATQNPSLGSAAPYGAYIEGNFIVLTPTPSAGGYNLVMGYYQRPNQMVLAATCDLIASTPVADTLTLAASSAHPGSFRLDVVKGQPHFQLWQTFLLGAISGTSVTFPANSLTNRAFIEAGDYVCQANTTCIVPLPVEIQPLLEVRTAMAICRAKNDQSGLLNSLKDEAAEMESLLFAFFSNRVEGQTETLGANGLMDNSGVSGYGARNSLF